MSGDRHTVLIVDDEEIVATTLQLIFSAKGYEARTAYSAEGAVEVLAEWVPDLMVIDVILPGMNGVELAVKVKEQFPTCRTLLVSGQAVTADLLIEAKSDGHCFEILAKPVHPEEMLGAAARLLVD